MPKPANIDCIKKPAPCRFSGSVSATKARYGSIAVLLLISSNHNIKTAIHNAVTYGNKNKQMEQPIAPIKKYGRRRPKPSTHVRSDNAPIMGCTIKPVTGPAIFNIGKLLGSAPKKA